MNTINIKILNFADWKNKLTYIDPNKNYIYGLGNKNRVNIFTPVEKPNIDHMHKANGYADEMLDEIEKRFNRPNMLDLCQIMIHRHDCPVCQASIPIFQRIAYELQRRLWNYTFRIVELTQYIDILGTRINGLQLWKAFNTNQVGAKVSGVPLFLQNFNVNTVLVDGSEQLEIIRPNRKDKYTWTAIYVGEVSPLKFLADCFGVKNRYMDF